MNDTNPKWTSDYFRDAPAASTSHLGRGLVGHVPIVAILLMVQGGLELAFGGFCLIFAALFMVLPQEAFGGTSQGLVAGMMAFLGIPGLGCGTLRIVAGFYNWRFRRRGLGMTALGVGLAALLTGYCAPTAIALAIYGLIVYVNESVALAFAMGDKGRSRAEIQAAFPP